MIGMPLVCGDESASTEVLAVSSRRPSAEVAGQLDAVEAQVTVSNCPTGESKSLECSSDLETTMSPVIGMSVVCHEYISSTNVLESPSENIVKTNASEDELEVDFEATAGGEVETKKEKRSVEEAICRAEEMEAIPNCSRIKFYRTHNSRPCRLKRTTVKASPCRKQPKKFFS
jgi:hypothetical protein